MATLSDFVNRMRLGIRARVPMFVWGPPGVGKTFSIESLVREEGMRMYTLIGSTCDPTDINGMPVMIESGVRADTGRPRFELGFAGRTWIDDLNNAPRGGLLFFDEYTNTPPDVRAALLRGLQSGIFGDSRLNLDRVGIIAAGNPPDQAANGQELDPPTANRFTHLRYPVGPEAAREWSEQFTHYWGSPPVVRFMDKAVSQESMLRARSAVAGFVRRKPEYWHQMPTESGKRSEAWASPRSWEAVSRYVGVVLDDQRDYTDAYPLMAGSVGEGLAGEFLTYIRESSLPDPEEVLADAKNYAPSGRVDVDFSVLMSVAGAVAANLTPDRYLRGWQVIGDRALTKRDGKIPAYESATAAAKLMGQLMLDRPSEITGKVPASERSGYNTKLAKFVGEYGRFMQRNNMKT